MKELYYYNIGYGSYEDSSQTTLTHTKKYTESDIEDFLVEYLNSRKNLPSKRMEWKNTLADIIPGCFTSFLCRKKGFKKIKYEAKYFRFGWPDIFDKNSWEGEGYRKDLDPITDRLIRAKKEVVEDEDKN